MRKQGLSSSGDYNSQSSAKNPEIADQFRELGDLTDQKKSEKLGNSNKYDMNKMNSKKNLHVTDISISSFYLQ